MMGSTTLFTIKSNIKNLVVLHKNILGFPHYHANHPIQSPGKNLGNKFVSAPTKPVNLKSLMYMTSATLRIRTKKMDFV